MFLNKLERQRESNRFRVERLGDFSLFSIPSERSEHCFNFVVQTSKCITKRVLRGLYFSMAARRSSGRHLTPFHSHEILHQPSLFVTFYFTTRRISRLIQTFIEVNLNKKTLCKLMSFYFNTFQDLLPI